jgi:transcriptional regulator GlxA family with amidase domain
MTCRVAMLAFDGVQVLDVTGPAAVFGAAAEAVPGAYEIKVVARRNAVTSSCGIGLAATPTNELAPESVDLLLIAGGDTDGLRATVRDAALREWTVETVGRAARYGSVCSGAFVLAAWGLLDGKRVATHWRGTAELAARHPKVMVDPDALYVEDGRVWTSAGITTGIDMALAIVERDHGAALATSIARRLVLHGRRAGHQSQFSALMDAQESAAVGGYADVTAWIAGNLDARLDVETLAARAGQSVRTFHRRFTAATGKSPAAYVATLRLDRARDLVEAGVPLKKVAADCGFGTATRFTAAFTRAFGLTPAAYRAARRV